MIDNLRADAARLAEGQARPLRLLVVQALLFDNGFQAVLLYRVARWFKSRRIPVLGPLFGRLGQLLTGAEISPSADIGPGLRISHGTGLVVGGATRIGRGAHLHQNVTLGAPSPGRIDQMPQVGDDVYIGAGACLLGWIRIGDGVFIGAHALVAEDIPEHSKVIPAAGIRVGR